MVYFLYVLFILSCVTLIATVLLQPGKSDAGALFTSSVSSTAFGPRGTLNILSKITIGAAATFMLSAFLLSQPALTGNRSVLETTTAPASEASPEASPAISPEQSANTNTAVTTDAANTAIVTNVNTAVDNTTTANTTASPAANNAANTSTQQNKNAANNAKPGNTANKR